MKGWGIFFGLSGIAAFFLPQFGFQLITVSIFDEYWQLAAVGHIVLGLALFAAGFMREQGRPQGGGGAE